MPSKAIRPTSIGGLSRIFGFKLNPEDATPGEYEIVMSFKDELSGKSLEMREAFRVVPAPAAPAPSAGS
jgi:hypothetical protein